MFFLFCVRKIRFNSFGLLGRQARSQVRRIGEIIPLLNRVIRKSFDSKKEEKLILIDKLRSICRKIADGVLERYFNLIVTLWPDCAMQTILNGLRSI
jgi:hypothetical protein